MNYIITDKKDPEEITPKGGKSYIIQAFWAESVEKYPKKVNVSASGEAMRRLKEFEIGDEAEMEFNLSSKDHNGRVYHTITLRSINKIDG